MDRKGFKVFKGDKELERETPISMELVKTIQESRISIVVFSRRYASCTWCLNELAEIVECMKTRRQIVIPIFYDVKPSVPRHQNGVFEEAFAKHEEIFKENLQYVQMWRNALQEVANLKGFDLNDRHESEFIRAIVEEVSSKLGVSTSTFVNLKKLLVSCLEQLQAQAQTLRIQWGRSVISSSPFFFFKFFLIFDINVTTFLTFKAVHQSLMYGNLKYFILLKRSRPLAKPVIFFKTKRK
ncbi:TMV resistance protein N-like [Mangifera indica]|uniref:TMV resistance protein N-like n=1 Tax=Mangifera indica TaxID=29780 RepID=UPI001CFAB45B|nr:TMV resistance protein N-like [Mangifera indica]